MNKKESSSITITSTLKIFKKRGFLSSLHEKEPSSITGTKQQAPTLLIEKGYYISKVKHLSLLVIRSLKENYLKGIAKERL